jgi:ADP-heptose:LPS heptosyltransferase
MARAANRLRALAGAVGQAIRGPRLTSRPAKPAKILVLHELLLGDTLMLAPLLAALRQRYPEAEILVTARPGYAGLFSGRPYGARVLPFTEREPGALARLSAARDCDIAILPGETRLAILARALGTKWVVGCAGGKEGWNSRATDERIAFPTEPMALADMFALLAWPAGRLKELRYAGADWPAPGFAPFDRPVVPYAVLHVGAGSPLRLWEPRKWRQVADAIAGRGLGVVWTAGKDEGDLVRNIDPEGRHRSYAGQLDLAQLWHLLSGATLAVTLDTGIAHMAKLTRTPAVALFGPGSAVLFGKGRFWEGSNFLEVTAPGFPCRDQRHLFKREIGWVRRCNRTAADCPRARCMEAIPAGQVIAALQVE